MDVRSCAQGVYSCFVKRLLRDHRQQHLQSSDSPLYICGNKTKDHDQETERSGIPTFLGMEQIVQGVYSCFVKRLLRDHRQQHLQSSDSPLYICGNKTKDHDQETERYPVSPLFGGCANQAAFPPAQNGMGTRLRSYCSLLSLRRCSSCERVWDTASRFSHFQGQKNHYGGSSYLSAIPYFARIKIANGALLGSMFGAITEQRFIMGASCWRSTHRPLSWANFKHNRLSS